MTDIDFWKKAAQDNLDSANRFMLEGIRLREALSAAKGYLMNAKIDLEAGARKRTAIGTIEGGLRMVEAALVAPDVVTAGERVKD